MKRLWIELSHPTEESGHRRMISSLEKLLIHVVYFFNFCYFLYEILFIICKNKFVFMAFDFLGSTWSGKSFPEKSFSLDIRRAKYQTNFDFECKNWLFSSFFLLFSLFSSPFPFLLLSFPSFFYTKFSVFEILYLW